jgi:hypothetical protein
MNNIGLEAHLTKVVMVVWGYFIGMIIFYDYKKCGIWIWSWKHVVGISGLTKKGLAIVLRTCM